MYIYIYARTRTCACACACVSMCACARARVCACVCAHISDAFVKSTHAHLRRAKRDGRLQYKLISFKNEPLFAKPKETC